MLKELRPALVLFAALTVVTGVGYPLLVTGVGHVAFPSERLRRGLSAYSWSL